MGGAHYTLQSTRTGGGSSRQDVRKAARQRRLGRDGWALAKPGCHTLKNSLARLKLGVVRELAYCSSYRQGLPRAEGSGGRPQSCRAHNLTHPSRPRKWCCAVALALSRAQVEEQCNDPKLMQCGLEKVVASDGSVEWVASHSKVSL
jgi:hypothetical protein